jgi:hypothetical protein
MIILYIFQYFLIHHSTLVAFYSILNFSIEIILISRTRRRPCSSAISWQRCVSLARPNSQTRCDNLLPSDNFLSASLMSFFSSLCLFCNSSICQNRSFLKSISSNTQLFAISRQHQVRHSQSRTRAVLPYLFLTNNNCGSQILYNFFIFDY